MVPVASTSKLPSARSPDGGRVRDAAHQALSGSSPNPAAGPRCGSAVWSGMPGAVCATSVAVADGDDGEPARFVLGVFSSSRIMAR